MKLRATISTIIISATAICHASDKAQPINDTDTQTKESQNFVEAELTLNAGDGEFAPYYIMSNRHGVLTQSSGMQVRLKAFQENRFSRKFSIDYGADMIAGVSTATNYKKYSDGKWVDNRQSPPNFWIQQLYLNLKFRGLFLTIGAKEHSSAILDSNLSSGDLTESGNARPIPEVRAGFNDFQNIPFTNGWVQIQGEISYGKMLDNGYVRNHYNYYNQRYNQGALYTYKRCYFRTKPSMPFSVTVGMQVGAMFGGTTRWYEDGVFKQEKVFSRNIKQFFKMFLPTDGGKEYYSGSSLGSWDIKFRYRLCNGYTLHAYFQKPFEDGSGIGFLNGWDGLWGLEFRTNSVTPVSAAVVEYLDFTNQSGQIHWDPEDHVGSTLTSHTDGADNYYNNHEYNPYAYYGMAIGTPFMVSPIYNLDGANMFLYNRIRGFHIGVEGYITPSMTYRVLGGYRKSWGTPFVPLINAVDDTSVMAEIKYRVPKVNGLTLRAQFGLDHGTLLGNNVGGCVSVAYRTDWHIFKK